MQPPALALTQVFENPRSDIKDMMSSVLGLGFRVHPHWRDDTGFKTLAAADSSRNGSGETDVLPATSCEIYLAAVCRKAVGPDIMLRVVVVPLRS